jgi:CheY-like chemotaxis protein
VTKIVLIDDDYATEIVVENLGYHGYETRRVSSYVAATQDIDHVLTADLVILDIIMERPQNNEKSKISGDRTSGMDLLQAIRSRKPSLPVLVFSATNDPDLIAAIAGAPHTQFLSKWSTPSLEELLATIEKMIGTSSQKQKPRAFIVHGHDVAEKLALKNYLQNTLGFEEPIILHEQPSLGRTIIEKLESFARYTDIAFVILTPDDILSKGKGNNNDKRRARQNVIFELGYFLGVFGRLSGRVVLLHKGPLDLPSDLSGVMYIDISTGIEASGESIRREVAHVG